MPPEIKPTQSQRFLQIDSPFKDDLLLTNFSGHERLGSLFEYHLDCLSLEESLDFNKIIGKSVTVSMELTETTKRHFHGYVTEFRYVGIRDRYHRYQATIRPWLWFLSRTADCRIFQDMKVPDIIKAIFKDHGMPDYEVKLSSTYRTWEYCVQYRETDLNFVTRLMEQEGMYFYFKHEDGKHTLILADAKGAHETFPEYASIKFFDEGEMKREADHIDDWRIGMQIVPEKLALTDYNFKKPKVDLINKDQETYKHAHAGGEHEIFDYPGEYSEAGEGKEYAKYRIEELAAQYERATGAGNAKGIAAGYLFSLTDFVRKDQNQEYLVISVSHDIQSDEMTSTGASGGDISYNCRFEVMPTTRPFRSPRTTPKPIVQGPQTALVVGPSGEEIYCDEFGRIKVQFYWDREGGKDENSSCWMRISNAWAGKNWGSIHIPRIGHEVVVSFLEGDPDKPLVTGSVYNADNMPPYELAANKTQSGIKSRSSKEGNKDNFNEIRFEDKKDNEELRIQAEKDMNVGVKNIRKTYIGAALDDDGVGSKFGDCPGIGEMNEQLTVFADRETFIKGNDTLEIAEDSAASKGRIMTVNNGDHKLTVKKGDQTTSIDTGNKKTTLKKGDITRKVKMGKVLEQAAKSIEFKVGGSSIKIEPAKITIKSTQILINGQATVDVKSVKTGIAGSAMVEVKGGIVKIN